MAQPGLLMERARELAVIEHAIAAAGDGSGRVVLVESSPGLGKTSLLAAGSQFAAAVGQLVLGAAGAQLERDLAWGVVRGAFAPVLADRGRRDALLEGAAGACASLFDPVGRPSSGPDAAAPVLHGLYWLVAGLAAERPLTIVVDDLHWVDATSARWVAHLAARVGEIPVCLLVAVRDISVSPYARAIAAAAATRTVTLEALSRLGTSELVRGRISGAADAPLCAACHAATGGNPFLLNELLRDLERRDRLEFSAEGIRRLRPESIRRSALVRLAELGEDATQFAFAVVILGAQATVGVAGELAGLDRPPASRAADALRTADVLRLTPRVAFVHPLVLDAVSAEIGEAQRAEWHGRAAELLAERGVAPVELAPHLLASEPGGRETVVATLRAAAEDAFVSGASEAAVACLRRALAEPPSAATHARVLFELGRAEGRLAAGQGVERLRAALAGSPDPIERALIATELADQLLMTDAIPAAGSVCTAAVADLPDGETELRLELLARRETARTMDRSSPRDWPVEIDPQSLAGSTPGERRYLAAAVSSRTSDGVTPMPVLAALALRGLGGTALLEDVTADAPQFWTAVSTVLFGERYDELQSLLAAAIDDARVRGSALALGQCWCFDGYVRQRLGQLADAVDSGRRALELFCDQPLVGAFARMCLSDALIDQGALAQARAVLDEAAIDTLPPILAFVILRCCRGRLRREEGDAAGGARDLLTAGRHLRTMTPAMWPWRAEASFALHHAGEPQHAKALAREAVDEAQRLQSPWAQSRALRALALALGEVGPLRDAAALTRDSPARLERANVLVDLGSHLRRDGQRAEATAVLRDALDLSDQCGAKPLADRARQELQLAGARPRRRRSTGTDALTAGERRVCEMAAAGVSNRDIAQTLFVSLRTVETHLTHSYAKLSITGRNELAAAIAREPTQLQAPQ